jgi:hypothetical protein
MLMQCECLVANRLMHPKDIDAIEERVNVHADPDTAKAMIDLLPSLRRSAARGFGRRAGAVRGGLLKHYYRST